MAQRAGKQRAGNLISVAYGLNGDPDAVAGVRRIFDEFTAPYRHATLSEVAGACNLDEIPTARGGRWYPATVRNVLSNRGYVAAGVISEGVFFSAQARLGALRKGPPK